jgi:DNA segregation ATPase FtsK/SpoIIIE-like protein
VKDHFWRRGIIERMETEGVVGAANHVGRREVLAPGGR